jgi:hypothetical protein
MRLKLHLERLQLRLRQTRLELRGFQFVFAIFVVVIKSIKNADNRQIRQNVLLKRDQGKVPGWQKRGRSTSIRRKAKAISKRAGRAWGLVSRIRQNDFPN